MDPQRDRSKCAASHTHLNESTIRRSFPLASSTRTPPCLRVAFKKAVIDAATDSNPRATLGERHRQRLERLEGMLGPDCLHRDLRLIAKELSPPTRHPLQQTQPFYAEDANRGRHYRL